MYVLTGVARRLDDRVERALELPAIGAGRDDLLHVLRCDQPHLLLVLTEEHEPPPGLPREDS